MVALTILAGLLRFSTLGTQSFWSDEAVTVTLLRADFRDMLALIPDSESTPPLYYVLAWPWTRLVGADELGLRSLSALAGTLTVPLAAAAAWSLVSKRAAVITAALVAVNPLLVWYSQEARAYSLLVSLVALSFLLFVRATANPTRARLALWSAAALAAAATHYFAAFVVLPEALILLTSRTRRAAVAVGAVALGGLVLAPLALAQRATGSAEWIGRSAFDARLATIGKQLLVGRSAPFDQPLAVLAVLLLLMSLLFIVRDADVHSRRGAAIAATVGFTALLTSLALVPFGLDYVITQNVLGALVPLLVAASVGFAVSRPPSVGIAAVLALCAVSVALVAATALDHSYQRTNWRGAAHASARGASPQLIVLDKDYGGWFARLPFRLYRPEPHAVDAGLAPVRQLFPERLRRRDQDYAMPSTLSVSELVFVNFDAERRCGVGSPRLLGSFRLVQADDADGYRLLRYRSKSPERVEPRALAACLSGHEIAILLDR